MNFFTAWRYLNDKLDQILEGQRKIMATQAEVAQQLNQTNDKLHKIEGETRSLLEKIQELINQIQNADVTPELQAAADAVEAQAGVVDDLVPDAPPPPPSPGA